MRRLRILVVAAVVLSVLAQGWTAPPSKPTKPPAKEDKPVTASMLITRMQQRVKFGGFEDPKTTLIEALNQLTRVYKVPFHVNEKAFQVDQVQDVLKTEVANPNPIPPMNVPLKTVLKKVLARVPAPSDATYLIRKDHIEITTGQFAQAEVWGSLYKGPRFPRVHAEFDKCPLKEALRKLAEQGEMNVVLDGRVDDKGKIRVTTRFRNAPLDTALTLVAELADLHVVWVDNVFYVSTAERTKAFRKRMSKLRKTSTGTRFPWGEEDPGGLPPLGGS